MEGLTNKYEDDEQLLGLLNEANRQTELNLYKSYRDYFIGFLTGEYHCHPQEAREVYPESFTIFCLNIRKKKLAPPLRSSLKTYLCAIGWRIFLKRYPQYSSGKKSHISTPETISLDGLNHDQLGMNADILDVFDSKGKAELVQKMLQKIDPACQEVLKLRFWEERTHEEIKTLMNFSTVAAARKRNFDCIQKLRKMLLENAGIKKYI